MNKIEKTIRVLSDMKLSFFQNYIQEAFDVSIEALREKAEREKGCEHCTGDIDARTEIIIGEFDGDEICVWINSDNSLVVTDTHGLDYDDEISFCPMCGRELEEHHEAD